MPAADVVAALRAAGCVFAEDEARLLLEQARTPAELAALLRRRVDGEPLEQVLGWAEFDGLRIGVEPGVFVPRRRTELLVAQVAEILRNSAPHAVVVDLCCGSGAVAAAVATRSAVTAALPEIHAADVDPVAVTCARRNLAGIADVHQGDLFAALPARLRALVDVVAASTPYVPSTALRLMPPEARDHEPRAALDGGPDGLDVVRRIVDGAAGWVRPGGHLLFDLGDTQAPTAVRLLAAAGYSARTVTDDELGATVVVGSRSA